MLLAEVSFLVHVLNSTSDLHYHNAGLLMYKEHRKRANVSKNGKRKNVQCCML